MAEAPYRQPGPHRREADDVPKLAETLVAHLRATVDSCCELVRHVEVAAAEGRSTPEGERTAVALVEALERFGEWARTELPIGLERARAALARLQRLA